MNSALSGARDYIVLARPQFHLVSLLPFFLGTLLAAKAGAAVRWDVFALSLAAAILALSATHFNGECFDVLEDALCAGRSAFSSGTGLVISGKLDGTRVARAASVCAVLALAIGIALRLLFKTGPLTVLLGAVGLFIGYFYSKPPVRLAARGIGEPFIGFCFGWLTMACGFYAQAGYLHPLLGGIALPIGLATVNVVWINEMLDFPNDRSAGKRNLVVRLGVKRSVLVYRCTALAAGAGCVYALAPLHPGMKSLFFLPAAACCAAASVLVSRYDSRKAFLAGCGLTIAACLATSLAFFALLLTYGRI